MDTKTKRKKSKKPRLSLVNAGPADRVSVLSTKCGGCYPKGLIVVSSHKIQQIIIIMTIIITILTLICQSQFSFFLDKKQNQLKLYFFPLVPSNFWN